MDSTIARGNVLLINSLHSLLSFYSKRRKSITRSCYLIIVYTLFATGSKSKKSKKKKSIENQTTTPWWKSISSLKDIKLLFNNYLENSPTLSLLSQLIHSKNINTLIHFISQISLLFIKAWIALTVAKIDGSLVSSLVSRKFKLFFKYLSFWLLLGIPTTLTNSLLVRSRMLLSYNIRQVLTYNILNDYLPSNGNSTIYQLINSKNPSNISISDPNHRLTSTVEHFANSCAILPSQLLAPVLDILIAGNHLSKSSENSSEGTLLLGLVANLSTFILRFFTPNFSSLNSMRNSLENKFLEFHSNIILNNEEIALAKGHSKEIDILDVSYFEYEKFERMSLRRMAIYNFAVTFIFKYTLGAFGIFLCAVPSFTAVYTNGFIQDDDAIAKLSSDFVANRSLLLKASDSLGKLIQSKKNIQNITGYADEIYEFQNILRDINDFAKIESNIDTNTTTGSTNDDALLVGPNVSYGDEITFEHVPLITPNGNVLVKDLSFSIKPGDNLLIIGPNGCGKSSLFRILGGLWDIKDPGKLIVPHSKKDLFYLPQRSYFTYGSLREQIIYPDSYDDYRNKIFELKKNNPNDEIIKDDDYLINLLQKVNLEYLLECDYSDDDSDDDFSSNNNNINTSNLIESPSSCVFMNPCLDKIEKWPDFLSIGEQQRLAMIRLYYHQPKFAVLDECTSSISSDLERECYRIATKDLKITVLSVCHRTTLWNFHSKILKFKRINENNNTFDNNEGAATTIFTNFDPDLRLQRHEELISIDNSLKRSDELSKRLNNLKNMKNSRSGRRPALMYIDDDE